MRVSCTALDYLDGVLVLQTDGGLLTWPSSTQRHVPGAVGELVFSPELFREGDGEIRNFRVARNGPLALLRDDAGLATAVILPPGELAQRVAVQLVMPDVEVNEGVIESDVGSDACPCPDISPAQVAASFLLGLCPQ